MYVFFHLIDLYKYPLIGYLTTVLCQLCTPGLEMGSTYRKSIQNIVEREEQFWADYSLCQLEWVYGHSIVMLDE